MLREVAFNDFFTLLFLVCLIALAAAKTKFAKRFNEFITISINSKYLKKYVKDQKFIDGFDALLYINTVLSIAIFCFLMLKQQFLEFKSIDILVLKLAFAIGAFMLIKIMLERLIASVFDIDSIVDKYLFHKMSFKNFLGLVLMPINAFLIYSITPSTILVIVLGVIVFAFYFFGILSFYKANQRLIKNNLFYFILYLCALEISPYVVLYEFITV
ncbi:DUF4271 domain-containing protein [Lacinutrix salivirga]